MSYMFEVYYRAPVDSKREAMLEKEIAKFGGSLTHREHPTGTEALSCCLTFEFDKIEQAESAAKIVSTLAPRVAYEMERSQLSGESR